MTEINSPQNARYKLWRALLDARGIKKNGKVLLSGRKLVNEFLRERPAEAEDLLTSPGIVGLPLTPPQVKTFVLPKAMFRELDSFGTDSPLLVTRAPVLERFAGGPPKGLVLVVALSDPGNLGALLRSADAFQVGRVILCQEACSPFLPRALRAASGATFRLPLAQGPSLRDWSPGSGFCLDMDGANLTEWRWPRDLYLVLGEEGQGLPENIGLTRIQIPMSPHCESLNATVAASIALFSYRSQHGPTSGI